MHILYLILLLFKVYVRHPELAAAKANRDYVFKQVCEAVTTISDVAQGKGPQVPQNPYDGPGELAAALDDFDVSLSVSHNTSIHTFIQYIHLFVTYSARPIFHV